MVLFHLSRGECFHPFTQPYSPVSHTFPLVGRQCPRVCFTPHTEKHFNYIQGGRGAVRRQIETAVREKKNEPRGEGWVSASLPLHSNSMKHVKVNKWMHKPVVVDDFILATRRLDFQRTCIVVLRLKAESFSHACPIKVLFVACSSPRQCCTDLRMTTADTEWATLSAKVIPSIVFQHPAARISYICVVREN